MTTFIGKGNDFALFLVDAEKFLKFQVEFYFSDKSYLRKIPELPRVHRKCGRELENSQPDDAEVVRTKSKAETGVVWWWWISSEEKLNHNWQKCIDKYKFKCQIYIRQRVKHKVLSAVDEYKTTIRGKLKDFAELMRKRVLFPQTNDKMQIHRKCK